MNTNNLIISENPLQVLPSLADLIGLNEAIMLQQIHYWITKSDKVIDGKVWIYNPISEWQKQFKFFSKNTIIRTLKALKDKGLVEEANHNKSKFDRTKWYSINYTALTILGESMYSDWVNPNTQVENIQIPTLGTPIPETNTETTQREGEEKKYKNPEWLLNIAVEELASLGKDLTVTEKQIRSKGEDLHNWFLSNPKTNKKENWRATLRNALKKDYPARTSDGMTWKEMKAKGVAW